jgi:hypothetical protein
MPPWPRRILILGLVAMILGALDPLEGSVVVVAGAALATIAAAVSRTRGRHFLYAALPLILIGVGFMWGLSAVGGFGGSTGRTLWWWAAIVPYPIGWVLGLVGAAKGLRRTAG